MTESELFTLLTQYLTYPGNGVYTVHTAKHAKSKLASRLYVGKDPLNAWQHSLKQLSQQPISVLGVCSDTGGGILRGANWGPLLIRQRYNELFSKKEYFDMGDVRIIPQLLLDEYASDSLLKECRQVLYDDAQSSLAVSPLSITEQVLSNFWSVYNDNKILSLGGDHSISYPCVKSFLKARSTENKKAAIIHFDAHTDLLRQRLGVGVCFGSWAYHILPYLPQADALIQLGIRSSKHDKQHWQSKYGIKQYWADEINENTDDVIMQVLSHLQKIQCDELYISFDIDCLDIEEASATGTPEPGGLTVTQCCNIIDNLAQHFTIQSADLTEVAPFIQQNKTEKPEPNTTLTSAATIMHALLMHM